MGEIIKALKREELRDEVKVFLGGYSVTDEFCKRVGADAATRAQIFKIFKVGGDASSVEKMLIFQVSQEGLNMISCCGG